MATLVWKFVREPARQIRDGIAQLRERIGIGQVLAYRNVILSIIGSVFIVAFIIIGWVFMPQYYTQVLGFTPVTMSRMMSLLGLSNAFYAFLIPRLSDRIGRKPVMIGTCVIGFLVPLSLLTWTGSALLLAPIIFVGAAIGGATSLFMGVVPSETVAPRMVATAVALVVGFGEVLGGVAGPVVSGMAADHWGLRAPMWITVGCLGVAILAASGLKETAPRALAKRAARANLTPP
jgi:MFS family permease